MPTGLVEVGSYCPVATPVNCVALARRTVVVLASIAPLRVEAVSYTHLTLPTNREV